MKKEIKTLVIDRSKWIHGEAGKVSRLLRDSDGKMCCLGFLAQACGASKRKIKCKQSPEDVPEINWPDNLLGNIGQQNTTLGLRLMSINDDICIKNSEREVKLKNIFKNELDINLKFVGKSK